MRSNTATSPLVECPGAAANRIAVTPAPFIGAKEAQGIGMTRGFRSSLLHLLLPARLCPPSASRLVPAAVILLTALAFAPHARAQSAATWNKRGQAAELKQDYDTAYQDYLNAHNKSPKDMRYLARLDRMRFQAAAQHIDRGRVLRQNGDIPGALNSFSRALEIDPSDEAAKQEIEATEHSEKIPGAVPIPPAGTASSSELVNDISRITGPLELKPISTDLITLNIPSMDTRSVYLAIGKLAGINVLFDDSQALSKRIPIVLNSVSLSEALRIVGVLSNTFYKVLTPDTIFVADNTTDKHKNLDDLAVQTFYLTNAVTQNDINEIATALRQLFPPPDQTFVVAGQDAIVMRAPPSHLMIVEKLLNDLDRTKPEVVVDVAILEVNRDKMRNLGATLPQTFSITPQVTPNSTNTVGSATGTAAALASGFTLNTLANLNATNFAVGIGGGTLTALLNDTDTRVLQNPSVRATDNTEATLKIGTRVPIATGSYNAGTALGTAGLGGLGTQTNFTYQDVGVTIDIKPQIKLDREVSMVLDIEDSTEAGSETIEGVTEPIFGQRVSKGTIQLRDGEPCLIAGLLSKTDNSTTSGTPGLASIPLLKYLFGTVNKEVAQDEIVFVLVPHIVRESPLTRLNTRAIDTGTSSDTEVRRADTPIADALAPANPDFAIAPPANITAAQGAAAMVPQIAEQATRAPGVNSPVPGVTPNSNAGAGPARNPTSAGPATPVPTPARPAVANSQPLTFSVTPAASTQSVNSDFTVAVVASSATDLFSVPLQLQFDPKVLQLVNVDSGPLLSSDGQPVALVHRDEGNGLVTVSASRPPGVPGVTSPGGPVCILHFRAIAPGDSALALVKIGARSSSGASLPATGSQAVVHVR